MGLWGLGGIGKTTLASALYNALLPEWECACFLEKVRSRSAQPDQRVGLQQELLKALTGGALLQVRSEGDGEDHPSDSK